MCMTVVHDDMQTCEQFLNLHDGCGLPFCFICTFLELTFVCILGASISKYIS